MNTVGDATAVHDQTAPDRALRCGAPRSTLQGLLSAFLAHIVEYRDYSPATARACGRDCSRLIRFLGATDGPAAPGEIRPRHVRLFLASLSDLSAATIRRTLYGVSSFFGYLVTAEIIDQNPAATVDPPKLKRKLPEVPSKQECQRMMNACETPTEELVIGLLLLAGLRRCEVLGLDLSDVAADLSSLRIEGKGGHQRLVPVSSRLRRILENHLAARGAANSPALLLNAVANRMQPTTFYRLFSRVIARAGLSGSGITPHGLRHTFASELVRSGVDIVTVSELLGHSNISTTSVYLHATAETKRDAVERLDFPYGKTAGAATRP